MSDLGKVTYFSESIAEIVSLLRSARITSAMAKIREWKNSPAAVIHEEPLVYEMDLDTYWDYVARGFIFAAYLHRDHLPMDPAVIDKFLEKLKEEEEYANEIYGPEENREGGGGEGLHGR